MLQDPQTIILLSSTLISSFLGSIHCLGMCGPIVVIANQSTSDHLLYHLGRLLSYLALGFLAGFLGQFIFIGFSESISTLLAPTMIGLVFLYMGINLLRNRPFQISFALFQKQMQKLLNSQRTGITSFLIGFFSFALPCGWLYGFVVGAATTNHPVQSMLILFMFWLGSLPILVLSPVIIQKIINPIRKKSPKISGVILILVGCYLMLNAVYRVLF